MVISVHAELCRGCVCTLARKLTFTRSVISERVQLIMEVSLNRNVYWSDVKQGNIKVATENGTYVKTIISLQGRKMKATSLAVNPARG